MKEAQRTMTNIDTWTVPATAHDPALHLRRQRAAPGRARGAALYVHGATFPSALSLFFRFDGRSWADALNDAGFDAWGFDFAGYGESQRYPAMAGPADASAPLGRADAAERQLANVLHAIRDIGGSTASLHLIAHSWGSIAALRCAASAQHVLASLTLFGPLATRDGTAQDAPANPYQATAVAATALPAWHTLTLWEQYRRFIADVPRGAPPLLLDRHIDAWAQAYLATDPASTTRVPPAVQVPSGPAADIAALRSGEALYDASRIRVPTLLVRGAWDSVCDERDVMRLRRELDAAAVQSRVLNQGTHLMHLETGRGELQRAINEFLIGYTP